MAKSKAENKEFGRRLNEAFNGLSIAEIAKKLDSSWGAVKNYMEGRVPAADILIEISNLTNCSIHWLLTGQGPKWINDIEDFEQTEEEFADSTDMIFLGTWIPDEETRLRIFSVAEREGKQLGEALADLVIKGLLASSIEDAYMNYYNFKLHSEQKKPGLNLTKVSAKGKK